MRNWNALHESPAARQASAHSIVASPDSRSPIRLAEDKVASPPDITFPASGRVKWSWLASGHGSVVVVVIVVAEVMVTDVAVMVVGRLVGAGLGWGVGGSVGTVGVGVG